MMKFLKHFKALKLLIMPLLLVAIYFLYNVCKIIIHQEKVGKSLPNKFRIEYPLVIDHKGYFSITGQINHSNNMEFIIDTKATCLAKEDDIENLNANYNGKFPIALKNAYGQKQKLSLYYFDNFALPPLSFDKPVFYSIPKSNHLYDMMYKNVLGVNILKHLFWKFSIDENKIILFSSKDTLLRKKETDEFIKIKDGLRKNNLTISIHAFDKQKNFTLDLGFLGEISINNECFKLLSKEFSYQKILTARASTIDTTYVFENVGIKFDQFFVPNCQITYIPKINQNLIGARFMYRFNFILGYDYYNGKKSHDDLYIKPIENFQNFNSMPYVSSFGFSINKLNNNFVISNIKIGSIAELANLKIGDKIGCIDSGNFKINDSTVNKDLFLYLATKKSCKLSIERDLKKITIDLHKN